MTIAVIGTGYVGLTTCVGFAYHGHDVIGIDIDDARIEALARGDAPLVEEGVEEFLRFGLDEDHLAFTTDCARVAEAEIVFLCLPTPPSATGHADLSALQCVSRSLRQHLAPGAIVAIKSTVPVGTQEKFVTWLDRPDVAVASNPEFLREGSAIGDFLAPDRIIVGADDPAVARRVAALFDAGGAPIVVVEPREAELIKYAANAFLATKLSFVNEIDRICDAAGADAAKVLRGVGMDHRIADSFLTPGPGWGGSCFPKDSRALCRMADDYGLEVPVIAASIESNQVRIDAICDAIDARARSTNRLDSPKVAVWGLTFKAGTDDTRESPAVAICQRLQATGIEIVAYDPEANEDTPEIPRVNNAIDACVDADVLVVLTEWVEFAKVDLSRVADVMRSRSVFDTRRVLDVDKATAAGFAFSAVTEPPPLLEE